MKKSNKIKLALLPSLLIIPTIVGITLTSCFGSNSSNDNETPEEVLPPSPEKPNPPKPDPDPEKPPVVTPPDPENPKPKYNITFKSDNTFNIGDPNTSLLNIQESWLKDCVIRNKDKIFNIPSNLKDFDWNKNIVIGTFYGNQDLGEINFDLTLNNANNTQSTTSITKNIVITGFSYENNKLKDELNRINNLSLQLKYRTMTSDEFDYLDQANILHYLNTKFESSIFDYEAVEFAKNSTSHTVSFKVKVKYNTQQHSTTLPLTSNLFTLSYTPNNNSVSYSLSLKLKNPNQPVNYSQYITLVGNLNPDSTLFNYEWDVSNPDICEIVSTDFTNEATFFAFNSGSTNVTLKVKTKSGKLVAESNITLNFNNEYYKIRFDNPEVPVYVENANNLPSTYVANTDFIKEQIYENMDLIFTRNDDYDSQPISDIENANISNKSTFLNNLVISNVAADDDVGKLTFNLTFKNASSSNESISNKLTLLGFNKKLTDEQLIQSVLDKVVLKPKAGVKLNEMTAAEGSFKIHNIFDYDEVTPLQSGVKVTISSAGVDPQNEGALRVNVTGSMVNNDTVSKTIIKTKSGFMVVKNLGDLDKVKNTVLTTPAGYTPYKELELIRRISTNYLDTGDWFSKAKKFGWDQYEKELVYQARFALYQSFHDNFSEINYYAKTENNRIYAVAEGVVKNNFNGQYIVQTTQEMHPRSINVQSQQILRVEYVVDITNDKSFYPTTHTTTLSFSNDSMNLNKDPGWWKVFGMQLPGYKLNIQTVDRNGKVTRNWWNHSNNKMRSFVFSIGGSQGRKQ